MLTNFLLSCPILYKLGANVKSKIEYQTMDQTPYPTTSFTFHQIYDRASCQTAASLDVPIPPHQVTLEIPDQNGGFLSDCRVVV